MNPNGILTTYEERMKANLQRYQRPEKPELSTCASITAPGASTCACSATSPIWTPARRFAWPAGAVPESAMRPAKAPLTRSYLLEPHSDIINYNAVRLLAVRLQEKCSATRQSIFYIVKGKCSLYDH